MRTTTFDPPNALDLINELDRATEEMMALHVGQVGGERWQRACERQQRAFRNWREYLFQKAAEKPPVKLLGVA